MNRQLAALSIALCLGAGAAHAQTTTITTGAAPSVVIEPAYRERIRSYVVENHVAPVETRERIVVGATVPEDVELRAVPSDWGPAITRYRYVYSNDRVMLVEPSTRKVIQIVE